MVLLFLVAVSCVLLALLYYVITANHNYWEKRNVPHEKSFLVFGIMFPLVFRKEHLIKTLCRLYEKFENEPYFGVYVFHEPNLVIRSPELVKKIMVKDFVKFPTRHFITSEEVDPMTYHSMFGSRGEAWKALRAKISPAFSSGKMKSTLPLMQKCADELTAFLTKQNGKTLDFRCVMKDYAVDVICSFTFGINSHCLRDEDSEIRTMATKLFDAESFIRNLSLMCLFFLPRVIEILRLTFLDLKAENFFINLLNSTAEKRKTNGIVRNDLLDLITGMKKTEKITENYKFDDTKMASQALTFFAAGNEPTSLGLAFALYEVALQSNIQKRLKTEAKAAYEKHGSFTYEALQDMKYCEMVYNETLRKWPLTTFLNREAATDYTDEETGLKIEKGTIVMIPVGALHFDPQYYPDPHTFNPERFSAENKSKIKSYTFLPFGDGPRICIAQRFSMLASKVALAHIMKDFTVHVTTDTDVHLTVSTTSVFLHNAGGIKLKITKDN